MVISTPILQFSARLVQAHANIHITIAVAGVYHERCSKVLLRYFDETQIALAENIRIISIAGEGDKFFELIGPWFQAMSAFYSNLFNEREVICYGSNKTYSSLPKPKFAIVDMFGIDVLNMIRAISKHEVPVYSWESAGSTAVFRFTAPEKYGGIGDVAVKSQELAKSTGKTPREIEYTFWHPTAGDVVKLPGVGDLYDYECSLQLGGHDIVATAPLDGFHTQLYSMMRDCDGLIINNNPVLEPEATEAFRKWFEETDRPCFAVGPLIASNFDIQKFIDEEIEISSDGQKIISFLERIRKSHGKRSLLFAAFGTFYWPAGPAIWHFIDEAIMLITHNETQGKIPENMLEKLSSNENILVVRWSPQLYLVNNDTVGWFLSHCGNNSTMEAMYSGVPMIACPLDGDQPMTARCIGTVKEVGFELIEIRDWIGDRPFYGGIRRKGTEEGAREEARRILDQAFGPEGERRRKNAQAFREKMNALWDENGESRKDFVRLAEILANGE